MSHTRHTVTCVRVGILAMLRSTLLLWPLLAQHRWWFAIPCAGAEDTALASIRYKYSTCTHECLRVRN